MAVRMADAFDVMGSARPHLIRAILCTMLLLLMMEVRAFLTHCQ